MELYKALNITGLFFDLIGAILIFVYTPMHSGKPPGFGVGKMQKILKNTEYRYSGIELEKKEFRWIRIGMGFIISGFIFQLISSILT